MLLTKQVVYDEDVAGCQWYNHCKLMVMKTMLVVYDEDNRSVPNYVNRANINKIKAFPEQFLSKKQSKNWAFQPKKQSKMEFLPIAAQTQHKSLKKKLKAVSWGQLKLSFPI